MNFKKLISAFLALVTVSSCLLAFSGCKKSTAASKASLDHVFKSTSLKLPDDIAYINSVEYINGKLYYQVSSKTDYRSMILVSDKDGTNFKELSLPKTDESTYMQNMTASVDGSVWCIYNKSSYNSETMEYSSNVFLKHFDADGKELSSVDAKEAFIDKNDPDAASNFYISNLLADQNGNLLVATSSLLFVLDADAKVTKQIDISSISIQKMFTNGEKIYLVVYSNTDYQTKLVELDAAAGKISDPIELTANAKNNIWNSMTGPGYTFYYNDGTSVYGYDAETGKETELLNWINSDVNGQYVNNLAIISEKEMVCIVNDWTDGSTELDVLTFIPPEEVKEKYIITLAFDSYIDNTVMKAIIKFNKSSDEYRITCADYSKYNDYVSNSDAKDNGNQGATELNNDIIAGKIPDMFIVTETLPFESYINKGLIADLYPYIDGDASMKREDFLSNVFKAAEYDGKLYTLIPSFSIISFAVKSKFVPKTETGWTIDDLENIIKSSPEGTLAFSKDTTRDTILRMAVMLSYDQLVDKATGKCSFDTENFYKLLRFANTLSNESIFDREGYDENYWQDMQNAYKEDRVISSQAYLSSFSDYWYLKRDTFGGEDINLVGFPTDSKNGSSMTASIQIAMSAKSNYKDGVWSFLSYFLGEEYQDNIQWNWPVRSSSLDKLAEKTITDSKKAQEEDSSSGDVSVMPKLAASSDAAVTNAINGGIAYPSAYSYIDEESVNYVKNYVKTVNQMFRYNQSVLDLIIEESGPYFANQKTVEECAKIIQNRATTIVNESR